MPDWGKKTCYTLSSIGEGTTFAFISAKAIEQARGEAIHIIGGVILTFLCVVVTFFTNRFLSKKFPKEK